MEPGFLESGKRLDASMSFLKKGCQVGLISQEIEQTAPLACSRMLEKRAAWQSNCVLPAPV